MALLAKIVNFHLKQSFHVSQFKTIDVLNNAQALLIARRAFSLQSTLNQEQKKNINIGNIGKIKHPINY
jgi:hypothetical protein